MNQQAFYRDTAMGEFQLDRNGYLSYWSWGQRRRTIQAKKNAEIVLSSRWLKNRLAGMWDAFKPPGMTYEERFGSSRDR